MHPLLKNHNNKQNHHCEDKVLIFLKEDGKDEHFGNLSLEWFSKCNIQELQSFILTRCPDLQNSKLPKKEKLVDATNREDNLIKLAFDLRSHGRKLDGILNSMNLKGNTHSLDSMSRHNITIHSSTRMLDTKGASEIARRQQIICMHSLKKSNCRPVNRCAYQYQGHPSCHHAVIILNHINVYTYVDICITTYIS